GDLEREDIGGPRPLGPADDEWWVVGGLAPAGEGASEGSEHRWGKLVQDQHEVDVGTARNEVTPGGRAVQDRAVGRPEHGVSLGQERGDHLVDRIVHLEAPSTAATAG